MDLARAYVGVMFGDLHSIFLQVKEWNINAEQFDGVLTMLLSEERQHHYILQQIQQGDEREGDLRRADIVEPENVYENMRDDAVVNDDDLTDAHATKTDTRVKSPEQKRRQQREVQQDTKKNGLLREFCLTRLRWMMRKMMVFKSTRLPSEMEISLYVTTPCLGTT